MAGYAVGLSKPQGSATRLNALDGLRAVAVTGVLAYHAGVPGAAGGMFGVDIFFVLSGFLITRLLLDERTGSGAIRLGRFWGHRARRLLPPLALTVAGAMAYTRWARGDEFSAVRGDAISAALYVTNWRFVFSGQGYFARSGPPSPLLHAWSLGVEEQFYLLWPLVVVALTRRGGARVVAWCATAGAIASALWMAELHHQGATFSRMYYGTDTRAQALLVGAAFAGFVVAHRPQATAGSAALGAAGAAGSAAWGAAGAAGRAARRSLSLVGWFAAAALVWMLHEVGGQTGWLYNGGFFLVALLALGVVASVVVGPHGSLARALSWRPLVALGKISYGVYLYHWPLFLWVDGARTGLAGWPLTGLRVGLTLIVATVSYVVVERPIRLIGQRPAGQEWPLRRPLVTAAATVVASLGLVAATLPGVAAAGQVNLPADPPPHPGVSTTTLIVGDSVGLTLGLGLSYQSAGWGVNVNGGAWLGCDLDPGTPTRVQGSITPAPGGCPQWRTTWPALVRRTDPDVVMLVLGRWEVADRVYDGQWTHIGAPAWDAHLTAELDQAIDGLSVEGATVVVTTLPYIQEDTEQPDGHSWDLDQPARIDAYNAVVRAAVAQRPAKAVVLDLNALLDPGGRYHSSIDGVVVRDSDGVHISPMGGEYLRPLVLPELHTLGSAHAIARGAASAQ